MATIAVAATRVTIADPYHLYRADKNAYQATCIHGIK